MKLITLDKAFIIWAFLNCIFPRWRFGQVCDYLRGKGFIIY